MPTIRVIPAPGRRVRHIITTAVVPPEGQDVESSTYWFRKAKAGDVTIEKPSEPAQAKAKSGARSSATS